MGISVSQVRDMKRLKEHRGPLAELYLPPSTDPETGTVINQKIREITIINMSSSFSVLINSF